jgi:hypothetical protein
MIGRSDRELVPARSVAIHACPLLGLADQAAASGQGRAVVGRPLPFVVEFLTGVVSEPE